MKCWNCSKLELGNLLQEAGVKTIQALQTAWTFSWCEQNGTQQALHTTWTFSWCKQNQNATGFANHMDSFLTQTKPEHNRLCKPHGQCPDANKTRTQQALQATWSFSWCEQNQNRFCKPHGLSHSWGEQNENTTHDVEGNDFFYSWITSFLLFFFGGTPKNMGPHTKKAYIQTSKVHDII